MNAEAIDYGKLLEETKPEVIHGEPENRRLIEILERLTAQEHVTEAEEKLIALITVLVENFENQNCPVLDVGPLDIIPTFNGRAQPASKGPSGCFRNRKHCFRRAKR